MKLKFGNEIKKEDFDNFFNYIENLKTKKDNFFNNSKKFKNICNQIDNFILDENNLEKVENTINYIDGIDLELGNKIVKEIEQINSLLNSENKEQFCTNIKKLIEEKLFFCYENYLENNLKELVIELSKKLVDVIDEKLYLKKLIN